MAVTTPMAVVGRPTAGRYTFAQGEVWRVQEPAGSKQIAFRSTDAEFRCNQYPWGATPSVGIPIERDQETWATVWVHSQTLLPPQRVLIMSVHSGETRWFLESRGFRDVIRSGPTGATLFERHRGRSRERFATDLSLEELTLALLLAHAGFFNTTSRWPSI